MIVLPRPVFCLVTDRRAVQPDARTVDQELAAVERWLDEAIDAGVDMIQIRERDLAARDLAGLVTRVSARSRPARTRLVVNDRLDVAMAAAADGVHLRADGPPAQRVRGLAGDRFLIGRSIHSTEEAASEAAADYLFFGTVFPSASKSPGSPVAGTAGLQAAARATRMPLLAIGGVTVENAPDCRAAGAAGIAAIGLFLPAGRRPGALGPRRAVARLRDVWAAAPGIKST